jgi:uncharacterized protein YkwD
MPARAPAAPVAPAVRTALLVLLVLLGALVPVAPAAIADAGLESDVVGRLNQARAAAGQPALAVAGDLAAVARQHSARMADAANLHHNPNLAGCASSPPPDHCSPVPSTGRSRSLPKPGTTVPS